MVYMCSNLSGVDTAGTNNLILNINTDAKSLVIPKTTDYQLYGTEFV